MQAGTNQYQRVPCNAIYWLRVFRLTGFACKVLGLLILGAFA